MSECEIQGCDLKADHTVSNDNRTKRVCRKCVGELTALYGWTTANAWTKTITRAPGTHSASGWTGSAIMESGQTECGGDK